MDICQIPLITNPRSLLLVRSLSLSPPRPRRARAHRTPTLRRTRCLYSLPPPPFYLNVLTVIHGLFPLFFWRANAMYCVVGMCYVLASFPTFHFQFLSFIACIFSSFFFGLAFAGCLGLGLLLAHYSLGPLPVFVCYLLLSRLYIELLVFTLL